MIPLLRSAARRVVDTWLGTHLALRVVACLGHAALIWYVSSMPGRSGGHSQSLEALLHNAAHIVIYAALGALVWSLWGRREFPHRHAVAWGLTLLYGIVDELHQSTVPARDASVYDLGSDAFGAMLGIGVLVWCLRAGANPARAILFGLVGGIVSVLVGTFA